MKRFIILCLVFSIVSSPCFAWGIFGKKDKTKTETSSEPVEIPEYDNYGKGYVGTLPDISGQFAPDEPSEKKPIFEKNKNFNSSKEIKPVPRDNPAFVNIILKTDKTSQYIKDLNELLPQLENILYCIENNYDVQKFNAKVYFFNQKMSKKMCKIINAVFTGKICR